MHRSEDPEPNQEDSQFVEELLFRCLESANPEAMVESLCAEHPAAASRLRLGLARLATDGFVGEATRTSDLSSAEDSEIPERLGQFRILSRLGAGGMGVVYLAEDEKLNRQVAVKLVRPEQLYFPGARERFQREIEAIARLQHPGIVTIHSVGEEEGVPFFSMDYVRGISLARLVANFTGKDPGRLRARDLDRQLGEDAVQSDSSSDAAWNRKVIHIVRGVAEALAHAHAQGVIHRDVKPSNVLIGQDGRPRLLDFGLARTEDAQQLTRSTSLLGSLPYMAPEQVAGDAVTQEPTLDVYALGVTMYELLTLRSPFLGRNVEETRANILAASPEPMRVTNASMSADLETVCRTAMDATPARRYASMDAFIADLDNLLERRPIVARPIGRGLRAWRWCQRNPTLAVAVGAALIVFALSVGFAIHLFQAQRTSEENNYKLGILAATAQLREGRPHEAIQSLNLCPERLRAFEWRHLRLQTMADDRVYRGHTGRVRTLGVHPSGREFASICDDERLCIWSLDEGEPVRTVKLSHPRPVGEPRCVYDPDGSHLYVVTHGGELLRFAADGTSPQSLTGAGGEPALAKLHYKVSALAFAPDGAHLALGRLDGGVSLAEFAEGRVVRLRDVELPDTGTSPMMARFKLDRVAALAFSGDGQRLAVGRRNRIAVVSAALGRTEREVRHRDQDLVTTVAFMAGGKALLSSGSNGDSRLYDFATEKTLSTNSTGVGVSSIVHDAGAKRVLAGCVRGPIIVYDERLRGMYWLLGHESTVTDMSSVPGTRWLLTASYDKTIRRWSMDGTSAASVLGHHRRFARSVAVSSDSRFAFTGGGDGALLQWDLGSGERTKLLQAKVRGGIRAIALSGDDQRLLVAAGDLHIVDRESGSAKQIAVEMTPWFAGWFPDGRHVVAADSRGAVALVDVASGATEHTWKLPDGASASALVMTEDGRALLGADSGDLFEVRDDGQPFKRHAQVHRRTIKALAIDRHRQQLVTADNHGRIRFLDLETLQPAGPDVVWQDEVIASLAFSPDGTRMMTGTMMRQIAVWDRDKRERLTLLDGHHGGVLDLAFVPDGNSIVSVSMDGAVRSWKALIPKAPGPRR